MLNDRGVPNPTEYKRLHGLRYKQPTRKNSTLWKYFAISDMLCNEMYIGNMVQGKYGSVSYKTKQNKPRPKDEWYRVEGTHEAIIDRELWDKVQSLIEQNAKPFSVGTIGLFAQKTRCMYCGYTMRSNKQTDGRRYLQCSNRHVSKDACIGSFISVPKLEQAVIKELNRMSMAYVSISDSIKRIDKEFGPKRDLLLMDNNVLRSPKFDQIIDEIKALGFEKGATFVNPKTGKTVVRHVDFNQGLDAFLLNEHKAQRLGELAIKPARIAFDHIEDEDVYVRAITLCARAGIDHMSNYLLYNGEDFTGKGHSYHADTPEDLFYRMHLTMELGENLTEELGRKIAIFSFPMRYIPLDNDQRGFIGANWNAKYLRALQCMLIPTQGKGIQGRSFFEADFGKTAEDFVMYLAMPERLLNKRGHFVERKDEPKFEREIRYTQWSENRHLIDTWMKYYSMFEKDTVLEYIGCNRFSVETLDKIENEELKKLYFLYLTPSATIRVFSDCTEDTKRIISTFILEELPFMYSRIVETILSSKPGYKVIAGILENFGEKVCTDLLKKIDLFSGHDNDKLTMLIKANKSKRLVDFDFSLLQFIPYFHVSNLLSKQEEQIIMNSAYELKEAPIRKILLLHLDELKDVLIKTNGAQPGDTQIISVIEEQIKELYHQISIFEL